MARTQKSQTTTIQVGDDRNETLRALCIAADTAKNVKEQQASVERESKETIKDLMGYGLFEVDGFQAHVQRVVSQPAPKLDVEALGAFLSAHGAALGDFSVKQAERATDRVSVKPTQPKAVQA